MSVQFINAPDPGLSEPRPVHNANIIDNKLNPIAALIGAMGSGLSSGLSAGIGHGMAQLFRDHLNQQQLQALGVGDAFGSSAPADEAYKLAQFKNEQERGANENNYRNQMLGIEQGKLDYEKQHGAQEIELAKDKNKLANDVFNFKEAQTNPVDPTKAARIAAIQNALKSQEPSKYPLDPSSLNNPTVNNLVSGYINQGLTPPPTTQKPSGQSAPSMQSLKDFMMQNQNPTPSTTKQGLKRFILQNQNQESNY